MSNVEGENLNDRKVFPFLNKGSVFNLSGYSGSMFLIPCSSVHLFKSPLFGLLELIPYFKA